MINIHSRTPTIAPGPSVFARVARIEMLITGFCLEGILSGGDFVLDSIDLQAATELASIRSPTMCYGGLTQKEGAEADLK